MSKSQWQISDRFIVMLAIAFGIVFLAMMILPMLSGSHKPRDNEWALIECRIYLNVASLTRTNSPNFDFTKLPDKEKIHAISIASVFDCGIRTNFVWGTSSNREIVIVCQKQFDNVHKPGFWNSHWRNPAHAVGYSDGTFGLISPEEFTNLNLNGFVSLSSLATNSEFKISKP